MKNWRFLAVCLLFTVFILNHTRGQYCVDIGCWERIDTSDQRVGQIATASLSEWQTNKYPDYPKQTLKVAHVTRAKAKSFPTEKKYRIMYLAKLRDCKWARMGCQGMLKCASVVYEYIANHTLYIRYVNCDPRVYPKRQHNSTYYI